MDNQIPYDYDVLFIGGLFPKEAEREVFLCSRRSVQNAANALQWAYVTGLDSNLRRPTLIINSMYIGSFPNNYSRAFIPTNCFAHTSGARDINVGFLNLPLLKQFSRLHKMKPYLRKWSLSDIDKPKIAIAYAATHVMIESLNYIKRKNSRVVTCLVIPDLPEYMHPGREKSLLVKLKSHFVPILYRRMAHIDTYCMLTKWMRDKIGYDKISIVLEGMVNAIRHIDRETIQTKYRQNKRVFLYTGGIEDAYGIVDFVDAFIQVKNPNAFLHICGSGAASLKVKSLIRNDERVTFLGSVPRDQALELQREAHFLVNPRNDSGEYTKYSFPSKTIEYLSSGSVVVSFFLKGMPMEYRDYLVEIPSVDELTTTIQTCMAMSDQALIDKAINGKEFVDKEKNSRVQTQKLLQVIGNNFFGDVKHEGMKT